MSSSSEPPAKRARIESVADMMRREYEEAERAYEARNREDSESEDEAQETEENEELAATDGRYTGTG